MQHDARLRERGRLPARGAAIISAGAVCGLLALSDSGAVAAPPTPAGSADLSLVKSDSADPVQPGGSLTYTILIANAGPDIASNVAVSDKIPSGVDYVSAASTQGTCEVKGNTVSCTVGNLTADPSAPYTPSSSATITLKVLAPVKAGTISNTAEVTDDTGDPVAANNSDTETTQVAGAPAPKNPTCAGVKATIVGTSGADVLSGSSKRDVIVARGGADQILSSSGKDLICAGAGADLVKAGADDDRMLGAGGRDKLSGQGGNDEVRGQGRGDRLRGGTGDDLIVGGPGNDRCSGGGGTNSIRGCED